MFDLNIDQNQVVGEICAVINHSRIGSTSQLSTALRSKDSNGLHLQVDEDGIVHQDSILN